MENTTVNDDWKFVEDTATDDWEFVEPSTEIYTEYVAENGVDKTPHMPEYIAGPYSDFETVEPTYDTVYDEKGEAYEIMPEDHWLVSGLKDAGHTTENIGQVYPTLETAASLVSSAYGIPLSGLFGAVALGGAAATKVIGLTEKDPVDFATTIVNKAQELMVYQPQTERGGELAQSTFYPFEKLTEGAKWSGEKVYEYTDSPFAAAMTEAAIQAAPAALPLAPKMKGPVVRQSMKFIEWSDIPVIANKAKQFNLEQSRKVASRIKKDIEMAKDVPLTEEEIIVRTNQYMDDVLTGKAHKTQMEWLAEERVKVLQEMEVYEGLKSWEVPVEDFKAARTKFYDLTKKIDDLYNETEMASLITELYEYGKKEEVAYKERLKHMDKEFVGKESEARFAATRVGDPRTYWQKFKEYTSKKYNSLANKVKREYEHLPRTARYAELRKELLRLTKQKDISTDRTLTIIEGIVKKLDKDSYDTFTRKVILEDIYEDVRHAAMQNKEPVYPYGMNKETFGINTENTQRAYVSNPKVIEAFTKRKKVWKALRTDYIRAMQDIGVDVSSKFWRDNYYRHLVMDYLETEGLHGTGKRLRSPTGRSHLKNRNFTDKDFCADYYHVESEIMSQLMYDIEMAKVVKKVQQLHDYKPQIRRNLKSLYKSKLEELSKRAGLTPKEISVKINKFVNDDWKKHIPDGYTIWQPREGNAFYMTDTIPGGIAEKIFGSMLSEVGINKGEVNRVMAKGSRYRELVVPKEVAVTLDNITKATSENPILSGHKKALRLWKIWQLLSPKRAAPYNIRNFTGDLDAMVAGNRIEAFKQLPKALKEISEYYTTKKMTPELKQWYERGGTLSTLQAQEMKALGELQQLMTREALAVQGKAGKIASVPLAVVQKYWRIVRKITDARESWLRYANYLDYIEQMKKNKGTPKNFGASRKAEVMGLADINDRAYWLSNDLIGAYDRIGVMGQAMREHLVPFWSFQEVNFKRFNQMARNAAQDGEIASFIGKKLLGKVANPYLYYRIGTFAAKAMSVWAGLQAYNELRYGDLEENLPDHVRNRPHITLGQDENGEIRYINRLGALGDYLEWFGLDTPSQYVHDFMNGKKSVNEIAKEWYREEQGWGPDKEYPGKSAINKFVNAWEPFTKVAGEVLTRQSLFPDALNPRVIRDRFEHALQSIPLAQDAYRWAIDKPTYYSGGDELSKKTGKWLGGFVYHKSDPLQSSYSEILREKKKFMEKIGKSYTGFWITPKGDALYNAKLALRYKDTGAFNKHMQLYFERGGTVKGLKRSMEMLKPLAGLTEKERGIFMLLLDGDMQRRYGEALAFYVEMRTGQDLSKSMKEQEVEDDWEVVPEKEQSKYGPKPPNSYGNRVDGTPKGPGFLGTLKRPDGKISTELSIGVEFDGKERLIPALVPTLTKTEIDYLLEGNNPSKTIINKSINFYKKKT